MFFYPKLKRVANPLGILKDIKTYTLSELDLTNEIKGRQKLKEIYERLKDRLILKNWISLLFTKIFLMTMC